MLKKILLPLLIILLIVVISCKKENKPKEEVKVQSTENIETIFAVNSSKVVKGEINDYIQLNGDIKSKTEVDVYPDNTGKLAKLYVKIGQYVEKDEKIAEIDPSKPGLDYSLSPVKAPISGTIMDLPLQEGSTISIQSPIAKIGILSNIEITTTVSEKFISKMKNGLECIIKIEAYPDVQFTGYIAMLNPVVNPKTRMMEIKIYLNNRDPRIKPGMFSKIKIITERKNNIVKIPIDAIVKRYGEYFVFVIKYKIPEVLSSDEIKSIASKNPSTDDLTTLNTLYKNDGISVDEFIKKNVNQKTKSKKDEVKLSFKLITNLNSNQKEQLLKFLNSFGYYFVEKRKIEVGIQIDNKVEIVSGLNQDEEIVVRGQTLLEDKTRVKVIEKIDSLSATDKVQ